MFALKGKALVGLFVLGGLVLFGLGLFWIGDRRMLFANSIELATEFSNLGSLKGGSKVFVSGMDAGEVLAIEVPSRPGAKFRVHFRVLDQFRPILRTDSVATIQVEGLVGSKVLQVDAGTADAPQLKPGAVIPSREPVEVGQLIQQAVDTVKNVNQAVDEVHAQVAVAVTTLTDLGRDAQKLVKDVGTDAADVVATGKRVVSRVDKLVMAAGEGRGTVGKLLTDETIYRKARATVDNIESITGNARTASEDLKQLATDLKKRDVGGSIQKTAQNLQQATGELKGAISALRPSTGGNGTGLLDDVRGTLEHTREATSDLADNMEALKHNWFFRGFFKKRGFYDLDSLTVEEYKKGKIAPDRDRKREWAHLSELFTKDDSGAEVLSDAGMKKLDQIATPYLQYSANTPLIVEGYAGDGATADQFLRSRDRARAVRRYLVDRFDLKMQYIGAMPMGAVRSEGSAGTPWDGVAVVYFPPKKK